jgi:hypothetical protein
LPNQAPADSVSIEQIQVTPSEAADTSGK